MKKILVNKILKKSQLWGLKTFEYEMTWRLKGLSNPLYKIIGTLIGDINTLQMKLDRWLRKNIQK